MVTRELGKLAKWMRILGYDSVYCADERPADIIIRALREERVILTRRAAYKKYAGVRTVVVRYDNVEDQLSQVVKDECLTVDEKRLFSRCIECNHPLEGVCRDDARGNVPEYVYATQGEFKKCPDCMKFFWRGTHWTMVDKWLKEHRPGT